MPAAPNVHQRGSALLISIGSLLLLLGLAGLAYTYIWPVKMGRPSAQLQQPASVAQAVGNDAKVQASGGSPPDSMNPAWFGRWRGTTQDARLVIAPHEWVSSGTFIHDGKSMSYEHHCKWTSESEDNPPQDVPCVFGYGKRSKSQAELLRAFENSVAQFKADPNDFRVTDPAQSLRALRAIKPGNYRVIWSYSGGDCGFAEHILDQDALLMVSECKYRHSVELFAREK